MLPHVIRCIRHGTRFGQSTSCSLLLLRGLQVFLPFNRPCLSAVFLWPYSSQVRPLLPIFIIHARLPSANQYIPISPRTPCLHMIQARPPLSSPLVQKDPTKSTTAGLSFTWKDLTDPSKPKTALMTESPTGRRSTPHLPFCAPRPPQYCVYLLKSRRYGKVTFEVVSPTVPGVVTAAILIGLYSVASPWIHP